jgi:hypothetical protein
MTQFVAATPAGKILYGMGRPDPVGFTGVPDMRPFPRDGTIFYSWQEKLALTGPEDTHEYRWTDAGPKWIEITSIEQKKIARRALVNAWWQEANNSYFEFRGSRIAYGESDRVDIQGINNVVLLTGAMPTNPDWPAAWKTLDNDWVPLPGVADWIEFNIAIADRGTAHFKQAQMLKAQLEAATTAAEIEAITW